jgi:hypothetical protein
MQKRLLPLILASACGLVCAQDRPASAPPPQDWTGQSGALKQRAAIEAEPRAFVVPQGTRVLLNVIKSISTKDAQVGDRIYLETAFPVLASGRIVVPQGSWVTGTVTEVKRPGRMKGKGELQVRFDSLTLPNGSSRSFRADLASLDARDNEKLKGEQSKITGPGDKRGDVGTVVGSTTSGTVIGSGVGAAAGNAARGAGIGAGAGAAAGMLGVLLSRGPDANLSRGSTIEMVLDRNITFNEDELDFRNVPPRAALSEGRPAAPTTNQPRIGFPPF